MEVLKYCSSLVLGYAFSLYYGLGFLSRLAKRVLLDPFSGFWKTRVRELPPACLTDPELGTHVYVQLKNVKLHYVEKGDPTKPLMLLIHGFPEFWYSWRHQIKEFCSDYWVVAFDMRGYGDSEKPVGRGNYHMDYLVEDVKNLLAALKRDKCTLVTHDWGGVVAWYFVLLYPQLVDSYVIMNSSHPIVLKEVVYRNRAQFKKSWYVFFFQLPFLPELFCSMDDLEFLEKALKEGCHAHSRISEEDVEAFKFVFGKPGAFTSAINFYRANFNLTNRNLLKGRGQDSDFPPGLIMFGENDKFLEKELQEESAKVVANATLVYIQDSNHFVQQDNPVAVNTEIRRFLNDLKPK